jgi:NTP pyrophosphatase (non-canonical NTP hydrolase)
MHKADHTCQKRGSFFALFSQRNPIRKLEEKNTYKFLFAAFTVFEESVNAGLYCFNHNVFRFLIVHVFQHSKSVAQHEFVEVPCKKLLIICDSGAKGMDIEKVSKRIYRLQKRRIEELGCELTPEIVFLHLSEEIGEIARQLVNKNLAIRKYDVSNIKEEIAQAILDLFVLSEIYSIDLPKALAGKIEGMHKRQRIQG